MPAPRFTFHLIPNAHLDPVWLWDWREGLNEGLITCRTILDLMDEDKDLTFIRGESAIYQHIEQADPATFARIKKYVRQGRWDCVGGTFIQPDTNLPHTEVFARHYMMGIRYFQEKFDRRVRVGWAADSFGHAAGIPDILASAGITGFAFCRPDNKIVPIAKPAFWWQSPGGSRVLAYRPPVGWYGSERHELPARLDQLLTDAQTHDLHNVGVFFGLGNHGGGPTRRQIADIRKWAKSHPEIDVKFSTLHRLIDSLYSEVHAKGDSLLPTHVGELNYVLRGCYSSLAKFKFLYRRCENHLLRAEKIDTAIAASLKEHQSADLKSSWQSLLFNSFHDILPGSSIDRAFDDQIASLGGVLATTQQTELTALNALSSQIDTRVSTPKGDMPSGVAMLVFNPHPHPYDGLVEIEASLDYRPIWKYHNNVDALPVRIKGPDGKSLPYQIIRNEHSCMVPLAWRKRAIVSLKLPATGWNVIEMAYVEGAKSPAIKNPVTSKPNQISNATYTLRAKPGDSGIMLLRNNKPVFASSGLSAVTIEDPWGSWGGMAEEPDATHLHKIRHRWTITQTELLETGPLRATLWVRLEGGKSRLDLTCSLSKGRDAVDISARVFWNERSARLKLVMPIATDSFPVEYQVPAGTVLRDPAGQVPGGRWARAFLADSQTFGFASDALYDFDQHQGAFSATICRATRYANDVNTPPEAEPWRPAVDAGELTFRCLLSPGDSNLPRLAAELEQPPLTLPVPSHPGVLPRSSGMLSLSPSTVELLAFKPAADGKGFVLRVRETQSHSSDPILTLNGKPLRLGPTKPLSIQTYRIIRISKGWKAAEISIAEL